VLASSRWLQLPLCIFVALVINSTALKPKILSAIAIVITLLLAYANSLSNGFVWLDQAEILKGQLIISDFSEFVSMLIFDDSNYAGYHRPMYNLMHTVDYWLWGDQAWGFHLSSLVLHTFNVLLIRSILVNFGGSRLKALLIALAFGLLPCHTATVSLIHSKADLLACLFILLPIWFYSRTTDTIIQRPSTRQILMWCGFLLLALLSKEVAIMLPLFIAGLWVWLQRSGVRLPKSLFIYPAVVSFVFVLIRFSTTDTVVNEDAIGLTDRLLTFVPVYVNYIVRTLSSYELTTNDAVLLWRHMDAGTYGLYLLTFIALLVGQVYLARKSTAIAAGFLWFNVFLIPVSQLIPILHFRADRYLYIPSIGFVIAAAYIFLQYYKARQWTKYRTAILGGAILLFFVAALRIWDRNQDFASDQIMFESLIATHPECREAHGFVGNHYLQKGDYDRALVHINKALADQPRHYSFVDKKSNYGNLGVIYLYQGKTKEAVEVFTKLKAAGDYNPEVLFNLGICYKKLMRYGEAVANLEEYLTYSPDNLDALFNIGAIAAEMGDQDKVQRYFGRYLELNPNSAYRKDVEAILRTAGRSN